MMKMKLIALVRAGHRTVGVYRMRQLMRRGMKKKQALSRSREFDVIGASPEMKRTTALGRYQVLGWSCWVSSWVTGMKGRRWGWRVKILRGDRLEDWSEAKVKAVECYRWGESRLGFLAALRCR